MSSAGRKGSAAGRGASRVAALSPRQRDVLALVARGLTNREVGETLGIAADTVRTHVATILAALDVSNRTEATAAYLAWDAEPAQLAVVLDRPALAVLPVTTTDPRAAGTGDAIHRDLVALFSRWCVFPVIAAISTRDARGLGDSRAIGRALGARFLVDPAVTTAPDEWRLSVELVDAERSLCLWAHAWTFRPGGVFATQDELCQAAVAASYPRLIAALESRRGTGRHPDGVEGWQLAHDAFPLLAARERDANARARAQLAAAVERDPTLVVGHYGLGLAWYDAVLNQWGTRQPALDGLARAADRCVALAPEMAEGYFLSARLCNAQGRSERAAAPLRTAIACNPSFAPAHALLAQVLLTTGDTDEGLVRMGHARRLSPRAFVSGLAVAHFARREFDLALEAASQAIATNPRYPFAHAIAAAAAWQQGDVTAAHEHASALAALQPGFAPGRFLDTFSGEYELVNRIATALEAIEADRRRRSS